MMNKHIFEISTVIVQREDGAVTHPGKRERNHWICQSLLREGVEQLEKVVSRKRNPRPWNVEIREL